MSRPLPYPFCDFPKDSREVQSLMAWRDAEVTDALNETFRDRAEIAAGQVADLPKPLHLRRQQRRDGGYDMVPAYTAEEVTSLLLSVAKGDRHG